MANILLVAISFMKDRRTGSQGKRRTASWRKILGYPQADFFNFDANSTNFVTISVPSQYGPTYFQNYTASPLDADNDDLD